MHYLHMLSLVAAVGGMATSAAPYGYTPDQAVHSSVAGMLVMVNDVPQQPKNKSFRPIVVAPIVEANAHGKGNKWAPLAVPSASASASIPASASASASRSAAPHASVSASATPSSHAMDHIRDVYGVDMDGLVQTVHLPMTASAFGHGHGLTPRATNSAHADIADTPTGRSLDDAFPDLEDAVEHQPNLNPPHKRACADTEDFDANMLVKLPDGRAVPSCRHVKSGLYCLAPNGASRAVYECSGRDVGVEFACPGQSMCYSSIGTIECR